MYKYLLYYRTVLNEYHTPWVYRISFYYYGLLGCTVTFVIGVVVSLLTGGRNQKVDRDLLSPVIYCMLPEEQKYDYKTVEHAMRVLVKNTKDEENIQR